jgi:hypothetical protein
MRNRVLPKICLTVLFMWGVSGNVNAQMFPRFSIAGGPTVGYHTNNTDDINNALRQIGIPELEKGFLTLGGGGFVDLPFGGFQNIRIGGFGNGFSTSQTATVDGLKKTAEYSYGEGGLQIDYRLSPSRYIDFTFGAQLATGTLEIMLYQSAPGYGNWNNIISELTGTNSSVNISRSLSTRFYSVQPQAGIGAFLASFIYAKLNVGYEFGFNGDWEVDDDIVAADVPSGIKADGINVNLGLYFGLFSK